MIMNYALCPRQRHLLARLARLCLSSPPGRAWKSRHAAKLPGLAAAAQVRCSVAVFMPCRERCDFAAKMATTSHLVGHASLGHSAVTLRELSEDALESRATPC